MTDNGAPVDGVYNVYNGMPARELADLIAGLEWRSATGADSVGVEMARLPLLRLLVAVAVTRNSGR